MVWNDSLVLNWVQMFSNVGKTLINHPFGNGEHTTYKKWWWLGDGLSLFYPHYMAYLVFFPSKNHKSDCGAAGEVRDCHKSSFINESAELRLLCSDEGRKGSEGIGRDLGIGRTSQPDWWWHPVSSMDYESQKVRLINRLINGYRVLIDGC